MTFRVPILTSKVNTAATRLYAYGLRQPWRFSLDGRYLIITMSARKRREEVNYLPTADAAGVNFGWPEYEGDIVHDAFPSRPRSGESRSSSMITLNNLVVPVRSSASMSFMIRICRSSIVISTAIFAPAKYAASWRM